MLCAALLYLAGAAHADDGETCRTNASVAERAYGIPDGLLLAIGKRESGRWDASAGSVLPWPWTINREGEGRYFTSSAEAIAYVRAALQAGSRSIDVGCFQINLKHHPTAFLSLDHAFDPAANAMYAARFLSLLHAREGNWEAAVADYHSADPMRGVPYQQAVYATWRGDPASPVFGGRSLLATAAPIWTVPRLVMGIAVWSPSQPSDPARGAGMAPVLTSQAARPGARVMLALSTRGRRGLPAVITPSGTRTQLIAVR